VKTKKGRNIKSMQPPKKVAFPSSSFFVLISMVSINAFVFADKAG
jgi:hypothetical protein